MKKIFIITTLLLSVSFSALYAQSVGAKSFKEDNPEKTINDIFKVKFPTKDEFETTEAFIKRIPEIDKDKKYIFKGNTSTYFDIDNGIFSISIFPFEIDKSRKMFTDKITQRVDFKDVFSNCKFRLLSNQKKIKTYTASNAYGKKVKVTSYLTKKYYLDSLSIDSVRYSNGNSSKIVCSDSIWKSLVTDSGNEIYLFEIKLNLPTDIAKIHSDKIVPYFEVSFDSYFDRDIVTDNYEATIDDPVELNIEEYHVKAKLHKIHLQNSKTKEILSTIEIFSH